MHLAWSNRTLLMFFFVFQRPLSSRSGGAIWALVWMEKNVKYYQITQVGRAAAETKSKLPRQVLCSFPFFKLGDFRWIWGQFMWDYGGSMFKFPEFVFEIRTSRLAFKFPPPLTWDIQSYITSFQPQFSFFSKLGVSNFQKLKKNHIGNVYNGYM